MGLLYRWDFSLLSSFSLFPVGSDGAFRPHFAPWEIFSITPSKNYTYPAPNCNGSGMEMSFAGNFPSHLICNPKSRLAEQDAEMKAPKRSHLGMELEKTSHDWSEKFPAHPNCLFSSPISKIKEEERGSESFHPR